jgi:hypothetical protein
LQTTAVDPEANGQLLVFVARRTDYIEVQAVLRDRVAKLIAAVANTRRSILGCLVSAVVGAVQGLWNLESKSIDGRLSVRDAQKVVLVVG